jgi:tetratricopeptide (TPR) repeat protein
VETHLERHAHIWKILTCARLCATPPPPFILGHRFEAAVIAAENAAHVDPKNMEVMLKLQKARAVASARTLGNDLYKAGKMLEASVAYSEGLQYDPINAILLCNRAACRSKLGHFEKAVEDCNAALEAQPRYIKALLRRADSNFKVIIPTGWVGACHGTLSKILLSHLLLVSLSI